MILAVLKGLIVFRIVEQGFGDIANSLTIEAQYGTWTHSSCRVSVPTAPSSIRFKLFIIRRYSKLINVSATRRIICIGSSIRDQWFRGRGRSVNSPLWRSKSGVKRMRLVQPVVFISESVPK